MLWTISFIIIVLWIVGFTSAYTLGGYLHLLLLVALVLVVTGIMTGRNSIT